MSYPEPVLEPVGLGYARRRATLERVMQQIVAPSATTCCRTTYSSSSYIPHHRPPSASDSYAPAALYANGTHGCGGGCELGSRAHTFTRVDHRDRTPSEEPPFATSRAATSRASSRAAASSRVASSRVAASSRAAASSRVASSRVASSRATGSSCNDHRASRLLGLSEAPQGTRSCEGIDARFAAFEYADALRSATSGSSAAYTADGCKHEGDYALARSRAISAVQAKLFPTSRLIAPRATPRDLRPPAPSYLTRAPREEGAHRRDAHNLPRQPPPPQPPPPQPPPPQPPTPPQPPQPPPPPVAEAADSSSSNARLSSPQKRPAPPVEQRPAPPVEPRPAPPPPVETGHSSPSSANSSLIASPQKPISPRRPPQPPMAQPPTPQPPTPQPPTPTARRSAREPREPHTPHSRPQPTQPQPTQPQPTQPHHPTHRSTHVRLSPRQLPPSPGRLSPRQLPPSPGHSPSAHSRWPSASPRQLPPSPGHPSSAHSRWPSATPSRLLSQLVSPTLAPLAESDESGPNGGSIGSGVRRLCWASEHGSAPPPCARTPISASTAPRSPHPTHSSGCGAAVPPPPPSPPVSAIYRALLERRSARGEWRGAATSPHRHQKEAFGAWVATADARSGGSVRELTCASSEGSSRRGLRLLPSIRKEASSPVTT